MEFRILGPLEVVDRDGSVLPMGGPRERALLAMLLVTPNRVVPASRLVGELWGDRSSDASMHALQVCVSRLRKSMLAVDSDASVVTQSGGYLLRVDPRSIDAVRFETLRGRGRQLVADDQPELGSTVLREALSLWRGPALSDVVDGPRVAGHAAQLEEARVTALEERIDAELRCGMNVELVGELDHLTRAHPFRERLWLLRLLGLYRAGRQVDAVRAYQEYRTFLAEEFGLEPSRALADLDRAIVRRDPALQLVAPATSAAATNVSTDEDDGPAPSRRAAPDTLYATSGGVKIAYQVVGEGPIDVVLVPGFISNVDLYWDNPGWRHIFERLCSVSRLILWDKRGTGVSDPVSRVPTLDERAEDLAAVMDAARSTQATLLGISEGGALSLMFAATRPDRVRSLVLYGATPRITAAADWAWGWSPPRVRAVLEEVADHWGEGALLEMFAPTDVGNDAARRGWARAQRSGASPAMGRALMEAMVATDCREILPAVAAPTLVLHRRGDAVAHIEAGRYISERVPSSRFVELPGENHLITAGDVDGILSEVVDFLTDAAQRPSHDRVLATVLCTEVADVAAPSRRPGTSSVTQPHDVLRRELTRLGGRELSVDGGRTFATFVAPSRAIACAAALQRASQASGSSFRSGVHTGELELQRPGRHDRSLPLGIAAALCELAAPGQVLVSGTVKDLVAGSGQVFDSLGPHHLPGIPGDWPVFVVTGLDR